MDSFHIGYRDIGRYLGDVSQYWTFILYPYTFRNNIIGRYIVRRG